MPHGGSALTTGSKRLVTRVARRQFAPSKCMQPLPAQGAEKRNTCCGRAGRARFRSSSVTDCFAVRYPTRRRSGEPVMTPNTTLPGVSGCALGQSGPVWSALLLIACFPVLAAASGGAAAASTSVQVMRKCAGLLDRQLFHRRRNVAQSGPAIPDARCGGGRCRRPARHCGDLVWGHYNWRFQFARCDVAWYFIVHSRGFLRFLGP